ncbi:MAG TPA: FtsX-like permease family protein, partial [Candidatus Acidoferrales bacterium]|nr:FtsX-like permease family protein [Candidatus Acidoferrales bacterium]
QMLTGSVREVFLALVVALGLVLLIACANVANLLLARCLARQHEFSVRAALGASRWRLVQQLFAEGALLSVLGCAAGFGLASWAVAGVRLLPADTIPRSEEIGVHWQVVLILAAIATATTILSAILPALLVSRTGPQGALLASSRGAGTRSIRRHLSAFLVSGEVALSALLLVATGLLFHTLWNLEHAQLGFDVSHVTTFIAMPADASGFSNMTVTKDTEHAPPSVATLFYKPALDSMRAMPGVQDAALDTSPPLSGLQMGTSFRVVGEPQDKEHAYEARMTAVSGGYARLMGTPIVRGRMISDDDTPSAPPVIVVNETLARKFFGAKDPIGLQIDLGGAQTGILKLPTVIGVIADQIDKSVSAPPDPLIMIPYQQVPTTSIYYQALLKTIVNFLVKTRTDIAVAPVARSVFRQAAPDYALDNFQTMQQAVDQSNFSRSLGLYLIAAFAGLAVLMVVAGLYGVLAQIVSTRRREFGIRLALGASPGGILGMVLRQGLGFISAGIVVGIVIALFAGKLVRSFLYHVNPSDAWTYAGVVTILLLVGAAAALLPARRAASVEPMAALRDE